MSDEAKRLMEVRAESLDAACIALHHAAKLCASPDVAKALRIMADIACEDAAQLRYIIAIRWP